MRRSEFQAVMLMFGDAIKELIIVLVGFIAVVVFITVSAPFFLLFGIYARFSRIKYKYRSDSEKADGLDAVWGMESKESRPYITITMTMKGSATVDEITTILQQRLFDIKDRNGAPAYKKLTQIFSNDHGYYVWKNDKSFDLKNHVKLWNEPIQKSSQNNAELDEAPTDLVKNVSKSAETSSSMVQKTKFEEESQNSLAKTDKFTANITTEEDDTIMGTEELICRYLNEHGSDHLPNTRPQWEVIVLRSENIPSDQYVIIIRLHHSIGDGVSLVRLILAALVDKPIVTPFIGSRSVHPALKLLMAVWAICMLPLQMWTGLSNMDKNPLHGAKLTGRKRFHLSKGIKLDKLREIKSAAGATVNDVLMSCLSAALSKTFNNRWGFYTPNVTIMIPVSFHDLTERVDLINKFSMGFLKLPTPQSSPTVTPHTRLMMVKEKLDLMKRDPGLLSMFRLIQLTFAAFPAKIAEMLLPIRGITMGASNVPGPQHEMRLFGDVMVGVAFWVPDHNPIGAGISMISYKGILRVSLLIDEGLAKDPEVLKELLYEFEQEVEAQHRYIVRGERHGKTD